MDDDIEIEEHDILEHPEVKAVFPDMTKIQIQIHTVGEEFLEYSPFMEKTGSLLEERSIAVTNFNEQSQGEDAGLEESSKDNELEEVHKLFEETYDDTYETKVRNQEIYGIQEISDVENEAPENEDSQASDVEFIEDTQAIAESNDENGSSDVELVNEYYAQSILPDQTISDELIEVTDGEVIPEDNEVITENEFTNVHNTNDKSIENAQNLNDQYIDGQDANDGEDTIENHEHVDSLASTEEFADNQSEMTQDDSQYGDNQAIRDTKQWVLNQNSGYLNMELPDYDYEVPVKQEVEDYLDAAPEEYSNDELPPEDIFHYNNKIILGSKPSQQRAHLGSKISHLVVLLEDWSVHLNQSNSYCSDCKTLFPTPNALDAHKMVAHSFLTPLRNRAIKSTAKSSINVARKRTTGNLAKKSTSMSQSTYCNHCNVTFGNHTALISHLYELLPAKKYACNFCEETFKDQGDLVSHNSQHMKVEKVVRKSKRNDNNPILRNLLELRSDIPATKIKNEVSDSTSDTHTLYKCKICGEIFHLYFKARAHRVIAHPEEKNKVLFKTLRGSTLSNSKEKFKYEEDNTKKIKLPVKKETSNVKIEFEDDVKVNSFELIPKSTLFKCPKCSIHFLSCYSGLRHCYGYNCGTTRVISCTTCRRKLRAQEMGEHKKQHAISSKFKVYTITKDICSRTLCKCLKCKVHFRSLTLKAHIENCGKISTGKCKKCNLIIPSNTLVTHAHIHRSLKMKPKDFIIVDCAVMKSKQTTAKKIPKEPGPKSVTPDSNPVNNEKVSKEIKPIAIKVKSEPRHRSIGYKDRLNFAKDKLKLYFCAHCKCYLRRNVPKSIHMHSTKKCMKKGPGKICPECGLRLPTKPYKSHIKLHGARSLTLKDFRFFEFKSLRPMVPAIPKYPQCRTCKIHFINFKLLRSHICGEDYENCDICGEKFEMAALKVHRPFHMLHEASTESEQAKIIPELMKKYESLNAIWNVLFLCDKCELVTDLYNKAVEHSQAHLKKEHIQINTIKCYICNLKFDENCWAKHSEIHSRMVINNKDFKILKYVPQNLLDESWFQMFESLPEKEIRQIIDRSVFGSERSLKMRLIKDGLPEFTLYCCSVCQVSYDNNSILGHVRVPCKPSAHMCKVCSIAFAHPNTLQFHELLHKKGIKKDEFRIVNFEKNSSDTVKDSQTNGGGKVRTRYGTTVNTKILDSKRKKPKFYLYKCRACLGCVIWRRNMAIHRCISKNKQYYCKLCRQNFLTTRWANHAKRHEENPNFIAKYIKVIHFGPKGEDLEKESPSAANKSCKLGTPKNGFKASRSHEKRLNRSTSIPKSTAKHEMSKSNKSATEQSTSSALKSKPTEVHSFESLVNLVTSDNPKPKERTTHNSSKHKNDLNLTVETSPQQSPKTAKVYKCDCGLHYTSLRAIETHIQTCKDADDISKENCSKCGLLFPTDVLVNHLCKHHSKNTRVQVEEVHKKVQKSTELASQDDKTNQVKDYDKLYKCRDCNVYFLNQNSCYKHTSKHEPLDPKMYIECKMCSLQFRILSLHVHIKKHHEKEFDLQRVLVEEYRPSVGKQAPKIDIYFASERLQNVQVSSTND